MTYTVRLRPQAERDLLALPPQDQVRIRDRLDGLALEPRPPGSAPLAGEPRGRRKLRVGPYRAVY